MIDPAAEQLHLEYERGKKHGSIEFVYRDGRIDFVRRMETIKLPACRNDRTGE
jgi:hypothetical protein